MQKIIFGVFPSKLKEIIAAQEERGNIISDAAVYEKLSTVFSDTVDKANHSILNTLEYVGIPTATAKAYQSIKDAKKDKALLAAVVPLEMEEKIRDLFKKFQGNNISTINCP